MLLFFSFFIIIIRENLIIMPNQKIYCDWVHWLPQENRWPIKTSFFDVTQRIPEILVPAPVNKSLMKQVYRFSDESIVES